jgi:uncharacterized protein YoxC
MSSTTFFGSTYSGTYGLGGNALQTASLQDVKSVGEFWSYSGYPKAGPGDQRNGVYPSYITSNQSINDYVSDVQRWLGIKQLMALCFRFGPNRNCRNYFDSNTKTWTTPNGSNYTSANDSVTAVFGGTQNGTLYVDTNDYMFRPLKHTAIRDDECSMDIKEYIRAELLKVHQTDPAYSWTNNSNWTLGKSTYTPVGGVGYPTTANAVGFGVSKNYRGYWGILERSELGNNADDDVRMGTKTFIDDRTIKLLDVIGATTSWDTNTGVRGFAWNNSNGSILGRLASLQALVGAINDPITTLTIYGKLNSLLNSLGQDGNTQANGFNNVHSRLAFILGVVNGLSTSLGASSDAITNPSIYGKLNNINTLIGTSNDSSITNTTFGWLAAIKEQNSNMMSKLTNIDVHPNLVITLANGNGQSISMNLSSILGQPPVLSTVAPATQGATIYGLLGVPKSGKYTSSILGYIGDPSDSIDMLAGKPSTSQSTIFKALNLINSILQYVGDAEQVINFQPDGITPAFNPSIFQNLGAIATLVGAPNDNIIYGVDGITPGVQASLFAHMKLIFSKIESGIPTFLTNDVVGSETDIYSTSSPNSYYAIFNHLISKVGLSSDILVVEADGLTPSDSQTTVFQFLKLLNQKLDSGVSASVDLPIDTIGVHGDILNGGATRVVNIPDPETGIPVATSIPNYPKSYYAYFNKFDKVLGSSTDVYNESNETNSVMAHLKSIRTQVNTLGGGSDFSSIQSNAARIAWITGAWSDTDKTLLDYAQRTHELVERIDPEGGGSSGGSFFGSLFGGLAAIGTALGLAAGADNLLGGITSISSVMGAAASAANIASTAANAAKDGMESVTDALDDLDSTFWSNFEKKQVDLSDIREEYTNVVQYPKAKNMSEATVYGKKRVEQNLLNQDRNQADLDEMIDPYGNLQNTYTQEAKKTNAMLKEYGDHTVNEEVSELNSTLASEVGENVPLLKQSPSKGWFARVGDSVAAAISRNMTANSILNFLLSAIIASAVEAGFRAVIGDSFTDIDELVEEAIELLKSLHTKVDASTLKIDSLHTKVDLLQEEVLFLKSKVNMMSTKIDAMSNSLVNIDAKLDAINNLLLKANFTGGGMGFTYPANSNITIVTSRASTIEIDCSLFRQVTENVGKTVRVTSVTILDFSYKPQVSFNTALPIIMTAKSGNDLSTQYINNSFTTNYFSDSSLSLGSSFLTQNAIIDVMYPQSNTIQQPEYSLTTNNLFVSVDLTKLKYSICFYNNSYKPFTFATNYTFRVLTCFTIE